MRTAIITDSSCDLPQNILKENDIFVAPLRVIYSDREYQDGVDISADEIIAGLVKEVPKTSLPTPESLQAIIDEVITLGYDRLVGIFMSSGLSGTFNMACQLFEAEDRIENKVYDSKSLSLELGFVVLEMAKMIKLGVDWSELDDTFEQIKKRTLGVFTIDTLEYLIKGGRIGRVEATVGTLLQVKPIVSPDRETGVYHTIKKCRGRKRSLLALLKMVESYSPKAIRVGLVHCNALAEAERLKKQIIEQFDFVKEIMVEPISPALGIHGGPGLIGLICQEI